MDRHFASILILTSNDERYIGAAVDSVPAQTDPSREAIVVDDGSTDGSGAIIDAYAARDSPIMAVHQPYGGVAAARKAALREARGDWIHWLSSDGAGWLRPALRTTPALPSTRSDARELARGEHAGRRQGLGGPAGPLRVYLRGFEASASPPRSGR